MKIIYSLQENKTSVVNIYQDCITNIYNYVNQLRDSSRLQKQKPTKTREIHWHARYADMPETSVYESVIGQNVWIGSWNQPLCS